MNAKIQEKLENIVNFNVKNGAKIILPVFLASIAAVSSGTYLDNDTIALTGFSTFLVNGAYSAVVIGSRLYRFRSNYYHSNIQE